MNRFYPRLNESEVSDGIYKKILSKYIGASDNSIEIDPNTRKIIYADGKRSNTPIDNWEDIPYAKSKGKGLLTKKGEAIAEYIKSKNPSLDINKIMSDVQTNHLKRTNKTYTPIDIPEFPKGLTWGGFWDYQLDKNAKEFEYDLENPPETSSSKTTKSEGGIETEYKIPDNIPVFFKQNGKLKQWNSFIQNVTTSSGKSVIGEFNQLFEYMSAIINIEKNSEVPVHLKTFKIKKGRVPLALNDYTQIEEWKSEMVTYIGKYTAKDMEDEVVNTDGTYDKMIPGKSAKTYGFLATLMLMEPSGMGRGEVLMAYIIAGAAFAGGGESFDLTVNGEKEDKIAPDIIVGSTTFELKDYSDATPSIRLGTHGALTRFKWWKEIERTVKLVREITDDLGQDKVKAILEDKNDGKQLYFIWSLVYSNKPYQGSRIIGSGVDAGELNTSKVATLKVFYSLMNEFFSRGKKDEKGNYTYAILKGNDVKAETVEINPVSKDEIKNIDKLTVSYDKEDLIKFKELGSIKYIQHPLSLQEDLDKLGEHYAEASKSGGNKGVDYFMVFAPDKLDVDKLENFVFDGISQKAAKIISKKRRSSIKGEQHADKTFKKWKSQDEKSYYEIYHDMLISDKEASISARKEKSRASSKKKKTNESLYPRLFGN